MTAQHEYVFRFPAGMPKLDFASLAEWMTGHTARRIGATVVVRRTGHGCPHPHVIGIELYGLCIALVKPDRVVFPETRDTHAATSYWLGRIIADNGIGRSAWRIRRRKADRPGPPVARGQAGLLVIDGDRDRPVEGFAYRTQDPGGEPWCYHDGPDVIPGKMCECGQRAPLHSDFRERAAAIVASAIADRRAREPMLTGAA
jgi:hypothetical protein